RAPRGACEPSLPRAHAPRDGTHERGEQAGRGPPAGPRRSAACTADAESRPGLTGGALASRAMSDANREQTTYWNEQAGPIWVAFQERLDRQIGPHGERALALLAPRAGERVLDLGCGCGDSSLALATRVAPGGSVLGLDLSEPMLARARERAAAARVAHAALPPRRG